MKLKETRKSSGTSGPGTYHKDRGFGRGAKGGYMGERGWTDRNTSKKPHIGPGSYETDVDALKRKKIRPRSASTFGGSKRQAFRPIDKNIPGPGRYDQKKQRAPTYSFGSERRPEPGSHGRSRYEVRPDPGQYNTGGRSLASPTAGITLGGKSLMMDPVEREKNMVPAPGHYNN